jgi:SAM-dependent methyltransferase
MKPTLTPYLRCPLTGETLALSDTRSEPADGEIVAGRLRSASGREYTIERGVPVLLDPATFAPGQAETLATFSEKWERAPNYREDTRAHYERWYLERYGHGDLQGLERFLAGKRLILDAGTGHGRDAEMYARHSQAQVFGLDLSQGIHLAYRHLHALENLHLVQADLQRPPFAEAFFDFIACDQVIHHTPDTRASLAALMRHLAPGGHIAFYVYKVKGPIREFCDDFIRARTTRMSPEECLRFSEAMTKLGRALSDLHVEVDVPEDIPLLEIPKGRIDVQRLIYWHVFKCYWNDSMDWTSNVVTNFDWYHPLHAHRHTEDEVRAWCAELELEIEHLSVVEAGISVLGRKR